MNLKEKWLESCKQTEQLKQGLLKEVSNGFNKEYIEQIVEQVEKSEDFGYDTFIYRWNRFDPSKAGVNKNDPLTVEALEVYMNEQYSMDIDLKHDVVQQCLGPCIIINEDGDIIDELTMKWIIEADEYNTIEERDQLIKEYQEIEGTYAPVFYIDRYDNVTCIF